MRLFYDLPPSLPPKYIITLTSFTHGIFKFTSDYGGFVREYPHGDWALHVPKKVLDGNFYYCPQNNNQGLYETTV